MKVSLVVASGVHQGKVISIVGSQFLIGRDPQCQLRPASQAVSKQHCAVIIRDGAVYLKDYGSTNGTLLNDAVVRDEERQVQNNDSLKIGPLDFTFRIEPTPAAVDGTPLPEMNPETAAAIAAVRAATAGAASKTPTRDATPAPIPVAKAPPKPGSKETPALKSGSKEMPALKPGSKEMPALKGEAKPAAKPAPQAAAPAPADEPAAGATAAGAGTVDDAEHDRLAAMLLGLDDSEVPGGSTVVDVPIPADLTAAGAAATDETKAEDKAAAKKAVPTREDTSNAASEILRKMMRRPR
jgi:predicted component of type VI protein secretion system